MNDFKEGTKVHVEYDGVIEHELDEDGDYGIRVEGASIPYFAKPEHVTLIEPKFEPGDVCIDADDEVFQLSLSGDKWLEPGNDWRYDLDYPTRPLRKLTPA